MTAPAAAWRSLDCTRRRCDLLKQCRCVFACLADARSGQNVVKLVEQH